MPKVMRWNPPEKSQEAMISECAAALKSGQGIRISERTIGKRKDRAGMTMRESIGARLAAKGKRGKAITGMAVNEAYKS